MTVITTTDLQQQLDTWVDRYKTAAYIAQDPLQLPYRYIQHEFQTCELVALMTALLSYGRRSVIIDTVSALLLLLGDEPLDYLMRFNPKKEARRFQHFVYRFNTGRDIVTLLEQLQRIYHDYGSLAACFANAASKSHRLPDGRLCLQTTIGLFWDCVLPPEHKAWQRNGIRFMLAHPRNGGACKRFNMFLRWMVRQDAPGEDQVDLGLWRQAGIAPADLIIPLDTHVLKMNSLLELTPHKQGNWRTAEALTAIFRTFNPEDPVRYDYALFGYSLEHSGSANL
ncbi:MAG: TIGR02757 family protein [Cyanobacteria bacterium P01_H01_bin.74]